MTGFKLTLTLTVLALFSVVSTPTAQACDGCLAKKTVNTAATVNTTPLRVATNVIKNRPRLLAARTVQVTVPTITVPTITVPTITTNCCGEVTNVGCTNVGCTTACVRAILFPQIKTRHLANGYGVTTQASSVQTVLIE